MNLFIKKLVTFFLIGAAGLLLILGLYFYNDPFKVVHPYKNYSNSYVIMNRDFVTTQGFLRNNPEQHYNSFIFGSSRTLGFSPYSWEKYLSPNSHVYMFDASAESIYGIYTKLKFLDSLNIRIQNALIIICRDVTFKKTDNYDAHLFIKHPAVSNESKLDFQLAFLKAYLDPVFMYNYYKFRMTKKISPSMESYIEKRTIVYDSVNNQLRILDQERDIQQDPAGYYAKYKDLFYPRAGESIDTSEQIAVPQARMLQEIKKILDKNKTHYAVVISPLYEQMKFSQHDKVILENYFGDNLYDFSGKNSFTDLQTNYYETSHFRPHVGDSILQRIYRQKQASGSADAHYVEQSSSATTDL